MPEQNKSNNRVGDGRVFFGYLLEHFGPKEDHDATAARVLKIGQAKFGANRDTLGGKHLRSWRDGTRIVPKWAYSAALDLCLEIGYRPSSDDEAIACWKTWLSSREGDGGPTILLEQFSHRVGLSASQKRAVLEHLQANNS